VRNSQPIQFALLVFFLTALAMPRTLSAEYLVYSNRFVDTNISAPFMPSSIEECKLYQQEMREVTNVVIAEHDVCLSEAPREYGAHKGDCSKSACESLHVLKGELLQESSENFNQCYSFVRNRRMYDTVRDTISQSNKNSSNSSPEYSPAKVVRQTAKDAYAISKKCESMTNASDRKKCNEQIHDYAKNSLESVPTSPVVKAVQDKSFTGIEEMHNQAIDDMKSIEKSIEASEGEEDEWDDDWE